MAKGVSVKFKSYEETIPAVLKLLKLEAELKKYSTIVLKPYLGSSAEQSTNPKIVEAVLHYCMQNKNPAADVYVAEGADGVETEELFENYGYKQLAEKNSVGLIDLNTAETEEIQYDGFLKFSKIFYPKILKDSFIISIPPLIENEETMIMGSLPNMLGAYPSAFYSGFFTQQKKKIRKWPIRYSVYDILRCKMPQLAIIDASSKGVLLAGKPIEMDKQAAKILGINWKDVPYLKIVAQGFSDEEEEKKESLPV